MNAKQRVNAALEFRSPDRVPYGEYAIDSAVAGKILGHETYLRNKAKTQVALWEGRRDEVAQSLKEDTVALYKKLDVVDIVNLMAEAAGLLPPRDYQPLRPEKIADGVWRDLEGRVYKYTAAAEDITLVEDPSLWTREYAAEDFLPEKLYQKPDPSQFEVIDYVAERLGGEKYLIGPAGREVGLTLLGNMERGFVEMGENPEMVEDIARHLTEVGRLEDEDFIRPGVDAVMWGQDFSYNRGPMVSPAMFERMAVPFCRERTSHVHARGKRVFKHACGNNWALLDSFLAIGYDAHQSIQHSAGMTLPALRNAVGDRLCLWGGITLDYMMDGRLEDAKRDVRDAVALGREGGVILGATHSIMTGVDYDSYMRLLDHIASQA